MKYIPLIAFIFLFFLPGCLPEYQVANTFIRAQQEIDLKIIPPAEVFKYNHKGEQIPGFDSFAPGQQDSLLWVTSQFIRNTSDSILLENYMNSFLERLRGNGFNVTLSGEDDSAQELKPQSYVIRIAQVQLDEYLYPLEEQDSFLDTVYYKHFDLNAVDFSCWFELHKSARGAGPTTLLYDSHTAYDDFDGRFFNDPFSGTVRYKYTIDSLEVEDLYEMAAYLGRRHADYTFDYFLNQYLVKNLPEGIELEDYFHYNRDRNSLYSAGDERFQILGTKQRDQ